MWNGVFPHRRSLRSHRACRVPPSHRGIRHGADTQGEHPHQSFNRRPQERGVAGVRRQGWPRTQARCGADRIHRHDGAGEERDLPHGLETPEQGDRLLPRRGGEGKPQGPPELCQGDKGTETRSTFQGQEEQQGQSQEGRQADAHHCGQVAQGASSPAA